MYPHRCIFACLVQMPQVALDEAGEQAFHDGEKWDLPSRPLVDRNQVYASEERTYFPRKSRAEVAG